MIDLTKLNYFHAGYDARGRAVLTPKPLPAGFANASPVSRRAYEFAAQREAEEVGIAAINAALAAKRPSNWDRGSAVDRLTWGYEAQRALAKGEL